MPRFSFLRGTAEASTSCGFGFKLITAINYIEKHLGICIWSLIALKLLSAIQRLEALYIRTVLVSAKNAIFLIEPRPRSSK